MVMLLAAMPAAARVYCNITEIDVKQLRNGVQITVKSDGILNLHYTSQQEEGRRYELHFHGARNATRKNFIDVSKFPVSHIELTTPQDAEEGVGVEMAIVMVEASSVRTNSSSDRQSYIITVRSSRTLEGVGEEEASEEEEAEKKETELSVSYEDGLVSVLAVKADLQEVLGEIASESGTNLAVDDAVEAEANLHLAEMTVDGMLRAIASAYGLALSEVEGVYMFSRGVPQDLAAYRLSGTTSFPMRYTRAKDASGLLPTFLYSYLHVNEEQNAVVVTAPQQMLDKIEADLRAVDVAPPQILIEAMAVEFGSTDDLDAVTQLFRGDLTGETNEEGEPEFSATSDSRTGQLSYSNIGELPDDFEARIRVLETEQRAQIRAAPRMAVMNGHHADVFIGVRRFIIVEYISYGQSVEKIQGVDVGVKLRVTPLTGGGGEITLNIDPESTEVSNISEVDPETGLPVLRTRQAGTTVRLKDGETLMIGGLSQQQVEDRKTKIPVLGDIPLIGGLFRSRSRSVVNSELAIFVTPHILTPEGRLADEEEEQRIRERFLAPMDPAQ
jgi:type IV pilus assembly protein PilQ